MASTWVLVFAAALGVVLGVLIQQTRFCTLGALSDLVLMGDDRRLRMWLLAMAVAITGSAVLHAGGWIDLDQSIYRSTDLRWLSHLIGGGLFGCGMVLASGCGSRLLTRVGGGNLKSAVVCLLMGVIAYASMRGLLAQFRHDVLDSVVLFMPQGQDVPALLNVSFGLSLPLALAWSAAVIAGALFLFAVLRRPRLRLKQFWGGCVVGLLVVAGWWVTGQVGYIEEHPETLQAAFLATNSGRMESLSFVAPQAYALELFLLWSDRSRQLTFGIALIAGVVLGSGLWAVRQRQFRWEGFRDTADLSRHLIGGTLMGFGGVTAMGCSLGQGVTGVSTLAVGSFLSLAAIIAGALLTLRYQYLYGSSVSG